ncbi:hypothetical protein BsWGS_06619 [Bradybaena similaris]
MTETRPKEHSAKCDLLEGAYQTLAKHKCDLQKIKTDIDAVQATQKCTVSLCDNIEIARLTELAEDVRELIGELMPRLAEHAQRHPAAVDRDSGIGYMNGMDILEEGQVAMAERPYVGNSIEHATHSESRC